MRGFFVALLAVVFLLLLAVAPRSGAASSSSLRVATYNIHKGADRRGRYNLGQTIDAIARFDVDVIGLQEVLRNDPAFGCDDQPALIARGLQRITGRHWTYAYATSWITDNRACQRQGRGSGVLTEGIALLAPAPLIGRASIRLSEGRMALIARAASHPDVPVAVTHLSANRENQPSRIREVGALLPWAARRGARILVGDLNAASDAVELAPVEARYADAWAEAFRAGRTRGVATGSTRPGRRVSRIDYVFFDREAPVTLESVEVVDTSLLPGLGEVSDHHPVVATFRRGR